MQKSTKLMAANHRSNEPRLSTSESGIRRDANGTAPLVLCASERVQRVERGGVGGRVVSRRSESQGWAARLAVVLPQRTSQRQWLALLLGAALILRLVAVF